MFAGSASTHRGADLVPRDASLAENPHRDALLLARDREQDVLGSHPRPAPRRLLGRQFEHLRRPRRERHLSLNRLIPRAEDLHEACSNTVQRHTERTENNLHPARPLEQADKDVLDAQLVVAQPTTLALRRGHNDSCLWGEPPKHGLSIPPAPETSNPAGCSPATPSSASRTDSVPIRSIRAGDLASCATRCAGPLRGSCGRLSQAIFGTRDVMKLAWLRCASVP
jgi:hypothetical protein